MLVVTWPGGLMAKALVFGTKDCAFESHPGRHSFLHGSNPSFWHMEGPRSCGPAMAGCERKGEVQG